MPVHGTPQLSVLMIVAFNSDSLVASLPTSHFRPVPDPVTAWWLHCVPTSQKLSPYCLWLMFSSYGTGKAIHACGIQ